MNIFALLLLRVSTVVKVRAISIVYVSNGANITLDKIVHLYKRLVQKIWHVQNFNGTIPLLVTGGTWINSHCIKDLVQIKVSKLRFDCQLYFRVRMPIHQCYTCSKNYSNKRKSTRHMKEKHADYEHWNCVEADCTTTLIRRSTLSHHLSTIHGYTLLRAREFALTSMRGDVCFNSYYEDMIEYLT